MAENVKTPEIRFKGFADPWEQRKFSDLTDRVSLQSNNSDLPQVEYEDINSGEGTLNKNLRDKEGGKIGIEFCPGDVLYGKLRPYLMNWLYPQFGGVAVGDFWVLRSTNCNSSFLYRLVQTDEFQRLANISSGSKMPRADWDLISQSTFAVPVDRAEQTAIADSLSRLDNLITLHQCEPVDRPTYHSLAWEQRELGELYRPGDEKNDRLEFDTDKTISVSTMSWNPGGNGAAAESLPLFKVLRYGDLAFEGNRTKGHPYGKLVINDIGPGIMSSRFRTLSAKGKPCVAFWKYYLLNDTAFKPIYIRCTKRGTLMTELVVPELLQSDVILPSEEEQSKIGAYFKQLDALITLHQCES